MLWGPAPMLSSKATPEKTWVVVAISKRSCSMFPCIAATDAPLNPASSFRTARRVH